MPERAREKRLPTLRDTGRQYVENTIRARLASPGVERYRSRRGNARGWVIAVAILAALIAAMLFLAR